MFKGKHTDRYLDHGNILELTQKFLETSLVANIKQTTENSVKNAT